MEEPQVQWKTPTRFNGLAYSWRNTSVFLHQHIIRRSSFHQKRMDKYGPLFRTNLLGKPVVISTDREINRFIFQQEERLFQTWYVESFTEILGQESVIVLHGFIYKYLKNLMLTLLGPDNLKTRLLPEVEHTTQKHLKMWASQGRVDLKDAIATMIFDLTAKKLISYDESKTSEKLRENFVDFIDGLISIPLNIPSTAYYKCLQGRKRAVKMLKDMIKERQASPEIRHDDFLDVVLEEMKKDGGYLSEGIVIDLIFVLLFASFETTSAALTLAMKFLGDHPSVLVELTKEHEAILRSRENVDSEITWIEYKSMTFTYMVINETVRLANIVPGIFRKTIKDGLDLNAGSKTFMAFGGGVRLCVGADFSKLQMAVFLHYLILKFEFVRWTPIKGGDITRRPGLAFPNGVHVHISKKSN
ncbi:hypothetical protein HHK36_028871 [Tetracentron sinense]|uniref:Cytochrome P450 n=1 Tax=Tetracentron sinense TaxID=13715 RepID=A0A835D314_TETSI|nr:hypothetical protein HHK36_028871 [Tetracentron sinense]